MCFYDVLRRSTVVIDTESKTIISISLSFYSNQGQYIDADVDAFQWNSVISFTIPNNNVAILRTLRLRQEYDSNELSHTISEDVKHELIELISNEFFNSLKYNISFTTMLKKRWWSQFLLRYGGGQQIQKDYENFDLELAFDVFLSDKQNLTEITFQIPRKTD